MIRYASLLLILIFLGACNDSDHFGYDRLKGSIHYRLISLGDEEIRAESAHHLSIKVQLTEGDSLRAIKDFYRIDWGKSRFPDYFYDLLKDASQGDSISIIGTVNELQINSIFGNDSLEEGEEEVEIIVHIYEAFSDKRLRDVKATDRLRLDREIQEKSRLLRVLDSLGINHEDLVDGIYFKSITANNGRLPVKGDHVTVNYSARLGNGKLVDDNFKLDGLSYEVGRPDQVIPGFSIGISYLTEGAEAYFVIPSEYGFGANGSSSKIIPGFSVLVYQVSLKEISD